MLKNQMIHSAEVYMTVEGKLGANIKQRTPIARVIDKQQYYLDTQGEKMPLSRVHTARVPIVSGAVTKHAKQLTDLLLQINQDQMIKSSVVALEVLEDGTLKMKIRKQVMIQKSSCMILPRSLKLF